MWCGHKTLLHTPFTPLFSTVHTPQRWISMQGVNEVTHNLTCMNQLIWQLDLMFLASHQTLLSWCCNMASVFWPSRVTVVQRGSAYQLHEAFAALGGDDPKVRLTTVHHLSAGRRGRLSRNYFPHAVAVGDWKESWGGPGTDVTIGYRGGGEGKKRDVNKTLVHARKTSFPFFIR